MLVDPGRRKKAGKQFDTVDPNMNPFELAHVVTPFSVPTYVIQDPAAKSNISTWTKDHRTNTNLDFRNTSHKKRHFQTANTLQLPCPAQIRCRWCNCCTVSAPCLTSCPIATANWLRPTKSRAQFSLRPHSPQCPAHEIAEEHSNHEPSFFLEFAPPPCSSPHSMMSQQSPHPRTARKCSSYCKSFFKKQKNQHTLFSRSLVCRIDLIWIVANVSKSQNRVLRWLLQSCFFGQYKSKPRPLILSTDLDGEIRLCHLFMRRIVLKSRKYLKIFLSHSRRVQGHANIQDAGQAREPMIQILLELHRICAQMQSRARRLSWQTATLRNAAKALQPKKNQRKTSKRKQKHSRCRLLHRQTKAPRVVEGI
jgi:hypothetical protein